MSVRSELEELTKAAKDTLAALQTVSAENEKMRLELKQKTALLHKQAQLLDAYAHVLSMIKEGEIDSSQAGEELDRIIKLGLSTYKEASIAPDASGTFGEILPEKQSGVLENQKVATTLEDGRSVDALTAWLLEWREKRFGVPSGLVT